MVLREGRKARSGTRGGGGPGHGPRTRWAAIERSRMVSPGLGRPVNLVDEARRDGGGLASGRDRLSPDP